MCLALLPFLILKRNCAAHEALRQIELLTSLTAASGSDPAQPPPSVPQETRGFDEHSFTTFRLRTKEDAPDYRYMPDANLGVAHISEVRYLSYFDTLHIPSPSLYFSTILLQRPCTICYPFSFIMSILLTVVRL